MERSPEPRTPEPSDGDDGIRYSRRTALGFGGAVLVGSALGPSVASATTNDVPSLVDQLKPEILPRETWGADRPVTGDIAPEDDVRFLLVHHTASTNEYGQDQVADQIRDFYDFHTGPEKRWPDVAYNFFVDRYGGIWEARSGSIAGPVRGDATGGSQGFALLCSLIGDHSNAEVTQESLDSLTRLLAWLAERHGIDTTPGATVDFTSRGSNRWPEGAPVTTPTISGHRDMSRTTCPGDATYKLLSSVIPAEVSAIRQTALVHREAALSAAATPSTTATIVSPSTARSSSLPSSTAESAVDGDEEALSDGGGDGGGDIDLTSPFALFVGAAVAFGAAIMAGAARFRRRLDG